MDPIELMAIKPEQINRALGLDRVKVVRGSRKLYDYRQSRARRGLEPESESQDGAVEIRPILKCTDVACGGMHKQIRMDLTTTESQTDPIDLTHYWDTDEDLKLHNLAILTGHPRSIQVNLIRTTRTRSNANIEIQQSGSSTVNATQVNMLQQTKPLQSGFKKLFRRCFKRLFKSSSPPLEEASSSWSDDDHQQPPPNEPIERDHEWMEFTSSEKSQDDIQADYNLAQEKNPPVQTRIELECYQLMTVMNPLWWVLKCGGRWPFETYVEDHLYKFRLKKWTPGFCVFILTTSFLLFCTSVGLGNMTYLVQTSNLTGTHQSQVEKVLFNKYWPYAVVTFMYSGYACVWSLATIFDDGHFLAQFMSRWNLAVSVIRYDPTEFALYEIWLSLGWIIFYCVTLFVFLIWDIVPVVRGTSDLLGMLTIGSFATDVKVEEHFLAVRVFGFLFHLYAVYSARVVTLWILMYCKFLENLARLWNLRFCYAFGMLGRYKSPNRYITYHTVVPFTKLFAEHKLITSFSRYTGKIVAVTLNFYFLLKGLEMITLGYTLFSEVVLVEPETNETQTSLPCSTQNCEEILYKDARVYAVMSILYFTCQSFLGWYITCEGISDCGRSIMSGYNFIRRLGFSRCRNSKERRFIQSLQFTFSPITNYYLDIGFSINRKFIYDMFAYVFLVITLIVLSSPIRLQPQPIVFCTQSVNGTQTCVSATVPRLRLFKIFAESRDEFLRITSDILEPVGTLEPATPEPTVHEPATPEPDTPEPATPEPDTPEPATPEPDTPEPATPEPDTLEPATPEPDTPEPATPEPDTPEPATPEPDTPKPTTPEPATPEPDTPEPATPEPATPEPATPEPATPEPDTPEPEIPAPPLPPPLPAQSCRELKDSSGAIWGSDNCFCLNLDLERIYLPVLCTEVGLFRPPYGQAGTGTAGCHSTRYGFIPYNFGEYVTSSPPVASQVTNCNRMGSGLMFNYGIDSTDRDDCGQLAIRDPLGPKPVLRQVQVRFSGGSYACCCYDYSWYRTDGSKPNLATNNCGLVTNEQRIKNCPRDKCRNPSTRCDPP